MPRSLTSLMHDYNVYWTCPWIVKKAIPFFYQLYADFPPTKNVCVSITSSKWKQSAVAQIDWITRILNRYPQWYKYYEFIWKKKNKIRYFVSFGESFHKHSVLLHKIFSVGHIHKLKIEAKNLILLANFSLSASFNSIVIFLIHQEATLPH